MLPSGKHRGDDRPSCLKAITFPKQASTTLGSQRRSPLETARRPPARMQKRKTASNRAAHAPSLPDRRLRCVFADRRRAAILSRPVCRRIRVRSQPSSNVPVSSQIFSGGRASGSRRPCHENAFIPTEGDMTARRVKTCGNRRPSPIVANPPNDGQPGEPGAVGFDTSGR
jgi:hypothetical protein